MSSNEQQNEGDKMKNKYVFLMYLRKTEHFKIQTTFLQEKNDNHFIYDALHIWMKSQCQHAKTGIINKKKNSSKNPNNEKHCELQTNVWSGSPDNSSTW